MTRFILRSYRFAKLFPGMPRRGDELPVWPRWLFITDDDVLETIILGRELWHRDNPSAPGRTVTARLRFYRRWLDPVLLPLARLILYPVNAMTNPNGKFEERISRLPAEAHRPPIDGFVIAQDGKAPHLFRLVPHAKLMDALRNVSRSCDVSVIPNDKLSDRTDGQGAGEKAKPGSL